jgi:hypothetical protein
MRACRGSEGAGDVPQPQHLPGPQPALSCHAISIGILVICEGLRTGSEGTVHTFTFTLIYFLYGLAFFSMGLVTILEVGRCRDARFRHALFYLAAFGVLHGIHEWYEMFHGLKSFLRIKISFLCSKPSG